MLQINKNTIYEIFIIVFIATILALLFNQCRSDSIPLIPKSKEELIISDNELFENIDTSQQTTIPKKLNDTIYYSTDTLNDTPTAATPDTNTAELTINEELIQIAKKTTGEFKIITLQQMKKIVADKSGTFLIIDARKPDQYNEDHIGNAINIYPYEEDEILIQKIFTLPSDKTIIVYCDGGNCDSSHIIAGMLSSFGFQKFYVFEGG